MHPIPTFTAVTNPENPGTPSGELLSCFASDCGLHRIRTQISYIVLVKYRKEASTLLCYGTGGGGTRPRTTNCSKNSKNRTLRSEVGVASPSKLMSVVSFIFPCLKWGVQENLLCVFTPLIRRGKVWTSWPHSRLFRLLRHHSQNGSPSGYGSFLYLRVNGV